MKTIKESEKEQELCIKHKENCIGCKIRKAKIKTLKEVLELIDEFKVNPKSGSGAMANAGRKYTIEIDELKSKIEGEK